MNTLRNQLDEIKARHEAARYPGDLASEVLPAMRLTPAIKAAPVTANRWFWALGSVSAVAASVVVGFVLTARGPGGAAPVGTDRVTNGVTNGVSAGADAVAREGEPKVKENAVEKQKNPVPYSVDLAGSSHDLDAKDHEPK